jgi:hypothetical protein
MSTIVFGGNTYTFGATVSANPGIGTTSYLFGGLNAGQTYGFIIWAFNSGGTSGIVGPTVISTLSDIIEQRSDINVFSWVSWPHSQLGGNYSTVGRDTSTYNLFVDSENLGTTWWKIAGFTRENSGITLPNGYTSGKKITSSGGYEFLNQVSLLTAGSTYIVSWYMHQTLGSASQMLFVTYGNAAGAGDTIPLQQILPVVGSSYTNSAIIPLLGPTAPGDTGWVRYAVRLYVPGNNTREFYMPFRTTDVAQVRSFYIGAPQLELSE